MPAPIPSGLPWKLFSPPSLHPPSAPLEPALRDYILLITILVVFLEATAQQLSPSGPALVMSFRGALDY